MTKRKRAMHYDGDRTGDIHVGQAMGPGNDGFYRRVISVTYDRRRKVTLAELEVVEVAGEDQRLRYYGDTDGTGAVPEPSVAPRDTIEPR